MADVQEIVNDVEQVEKEKEKEKVTEKKVVEVDVTKDDESNDEKPKENGKAENGDKESSERNGDSNEVTTTKRKSGAGDATDGVVEGATPEKKAKISTEEKETESSESTNGESEVAA